VHANTVIIARLEINAEYLVVQARDMEEPTVKKISYAAEISRNRGSISGKGKDLYIFQDGHASCEAHPASYLTLSDPM
jgi:hypothetical protein